MKGHRAFWNRWQQRRYSSLLSGGLSADVAWQIAQFEARYRKRVARAAGRQIALNAKLVAYDKPGGELGFALALSFPTSRGSGLDHRLARNLNMRPQDRDVFEVP